jgi:hypothetical protein
MYYIFLFFVVTTLLSVLAWRDPARGLQLFGGGAGFAGQRKGQGAQAMAAGTDWARLMNRERKEDEPCLTPIDCVQTKRCAGHCGWR